MNDVPPCIGKYLLTKKWVDNIRFAYFFFTKNSNTFNHADMKIFYRFAMNWRLDGIERAVIFYPLA